MEESTTPPRWRVATAVAVLVTGICVAIAVFSVPEPRLHIRKVPLPETILQCSSDADCVMVKSIGCCSCKAGGARSAIAASAGDEFRRFIKRTCRHKSVCVRVNTCRYDLVPACVGGRCVARGGNG